MSPNTTPSAPSVSAASRVGGAPRAEESERVAKRVVG
jgi:hypothetical protein